MPAGVRQNDHAGILLAAGVGSRFDATGARNKLLAPLDGGCVVSRAAQALLAAVPTVTAVVRRHDRATATVLEEVGCNLAFTDAHELGMSASLQCGLATLPDAAGWVIALGDMPWVVSSTPRALLQALTAGAGIAVPMYQGRRGNPVGFSRMHLPALMQLQGDAGARALFKQYAVTEVTVDDPGILRDVDSEADLDATASFRPS